jgi:hypothetical protein
MTWFKVDDGFWGHPKQTALPAAPIALWVRAGSWSGAQLTDGFVPAHMIVMLGAKKRDAEALVTAGLWEDVDGGYQFHDWAKWQPTRDEVEKKRAEDAERKAAWRKAKADKKAAEAEVSQRDSERTDAVTPRGVRSTRPDPTRPDPTRLSPTEKDNTPGTTVEGGSHVSSGPENDAPPAYPDHCPDHQVPVPPACGGCGKQKALNRANRPALALVSPSRRCLVHDETYTNVCRGCRADEIAAEETA